MASNEQQKNRGWHNFQQPWSKTQPGEASDPSKGDMSGSKNTEHRDFNNGDHNFNYKAKVTNEGGNFHDFGDKTAGLKFNGSQKDASIAYLKNRGEQGQEVRNFSGGNYNSRLHTNNSGNTIYPTMPIKETYDRATGGKPPSGNPVVRPQVTKEESNPAGMNEIKFGKQLRDKKGK